VTTDIEVQTTNQLTPDEPGGPIASPPPAPPPAPDGQEDEARERARSPREDAMIRIAERRAEALAREIAYGESIGLPSNEATDDEPAARREAGDPNTPHGTPAEPARPQAAPAAPTSAPPPEAQQPQLFPFDPGNGNTILVTADQLVQLARDGAAARLAVQQYQQQGQQPGQQQPSAQQQQALAAQQQQAAIDQQRSAEYFRRLTFGDAEEGGRALQEFAGDLLARSRQLAPDPRQIAQFATQQAMQAINLERNLNTLASEYTDIFEDRGLSQLAAIKVGELRQQYAMQGVQRGDLDLYRDACSVVRKTIQRGQEPANGKAPPADTASQAAPAVADNTRKLERKRAAPAQPTAVSRVASDESAKPWEGNRSAVVDRMRALRGQPSMR
jgi:hypothetical protein